MNKEFILIRLHRMGVTQREVASRLEIDPSAVSYLFSGGRELKAREVRPLATILGVTEKDILDNL